MENPREALPRTVAVLEQGVDEKLHVGAQLYVSLWGKPVADFGLGIAREGVPMTADSLEVWFSSTKAITAVAALQMWEQGKFDLDDKVARHIPEFGVNGKEAITIRHVLTHMGGFRNGDGFVTEGFAAFNRPWEEIIARICESKLEPGWTPGKNAGYHPTSGWFILGELVRRFDGRSFDRYVREAIFRPLGMQDAWIGMPADRYRAYGDRIAVMYNTEREQPIALTGLHAEETCALCVPGANGRGPMHDYGRIMEMLLFRGQREGVRLLSPQTVEAMTARQRCGVFDQTFQAVVDWGLGLIIDIIAYGRHCSPRTFGHGGAQSSMGFVDPEQGLVVAVVCAGMPGRERHYRRFEAISSAVYEDLGLAEPGSPGRDHPMLAEGSA